MAMEFLASIVTEVGKHVLGYIGRQINYLVNYEKNIKNLRNQLEDLGAKKKNVQNRVEESHWKLEEPTEEVTRWLKRATEIEDAVEDISKEVSENKRWVKGLCPDWCSRYRTSKKAMEMEVIAEEHTEKGEFSTVSHVLPPPSVIPIPGDYVMGLEPIEKAKDQLLKLLREKNIRAIGVYGMGGVGKTTLMKILNNALEEKKIFEKVIFVTVSKYPALKRIQDEIAGSLDLKLDHGHSPSVRAYNLSQRLKQEKKVLIILDDVWDRLEVSDVGIPSEIDHKGCKIVMTSRKRSVCIQMDTNRVIQMELLSEEDSWALFKLKAGEVVDSPTLQHVAKMVMRECKGLPLALVTMGSSLKKIDNKTIWREALRKLQSSVPTELEELEYGPVISSLQFSYDFLEGGLFIRLYFLFCCLFPEDENIDLKKLFLYGFGEDFLKVDGTLEEASNKGIFFSHRLKDSGLLLDYESEFVKMHDVVRDTAMYIAMKDGHGLFVRAGLELEEWPEYEGNEEYKRISLMNNNIRVLPDELKCLKLQTLLLQGNRCLEDIPNNFFTWMPSLRVLDLSYTRIKSLPLSLSSLTNLRTLCMEDCERLQDVSLLGGMEKLEILDLNGCVMIRELPLELCRLTNLKLLDLRWMESLERIQFGVISKLTRLEILDMKYGFSCWDDIDEENVTWKMASFAEMASLNRLTDLEVRSERGECLFQDMSGGSWRKLNRFDIQVGEVIGVHFFSDLGKKMKLGISSPNLANWVKVLLERTEELQLEECKDVESLEQLDANLVDSSFLVLFSLSECHQMKYVINFEKKVPALCAAFANLRELKLCSIPNLKKLCHGAVPSRHDDKGMEKLIKFQSTPLPPPPTSFTNLQKLYIYECDKLKNLFTLNLAGGLHQLRSLAVFNCKSMKELISKDDEKEEEEIKEEEEEDDLRMCKSLFPQLRQLDLYSLSELTCFYSGGGGGGGGGRGGSGNMLFDFPSLETIHIKDCPQLKRLPFGPHSAPNLKEFKCGEKWLKGLEWPDGDDSDSVRSRLQSHCR